MPEILPGYTWDQQSRRYRSGDTGRFIGRDAITGLLEQRVDSAEARMGRLAAAYHAGEITPAVWAVQMREEVKNLHLQNIALAKGGWDRLTQQDYGRVGAAVKAIYPKIAGSAADVQAGTVSLPQMQTRIADYIGSARRLYYQAEREGLPSEAGMVTIERRHLDPAAQHCGDCIDYAAKGWQPVGTLPAPGQACRCGGRCRCSIEYRSVAAADASQYIGEAATMPQTNLQEARNTGEWLEARLHLMFTEIADGMFGDGRLSREERIVLSSGIGDALDAFRAKVEAVAAQLYQRDPYDGPEAIETMIEASDLAVEFIPLVEKAVRRDGTIPIKVIAPGWGSSGYYPADVLKRDGPTVFGEGLQMFWDHQTAYEEMERPEGELDDLAAVLTSAARWEDAGPAGAGLYADAKVFPHYVESVDSLASHIGVSIRANGRATQGEAEGRKGPIIESITAAKSVDFVTKPGAGGQIISMFESARPARKEVKEENHDMDKLKEAQDVIAEQGLVIARMQEALLLREAGDYVADALKGSALPELTVARLQKALAVNPPLKEGALDKETYAARIAEAVTEETTYLQSIGALGSGRIEGMGGASAPDTTKPDTADATKRMVESFKGLGMSDAEAQIAAAGRLQ